MRSAGEKERTGAEINEEIEASWNKREQGEGPKKRLLPKIYRKRKTLLWGAENLSDENKCLLLKWYIGKFPIPTKRKEGTENCVKGNGEAIR